MLIKDVKGEFFDAILNQHVLILVAFDVDALCACRILQYLLQCEQILYTTVPVSGMEDLEKAFLDNCEGVNHVVLINCGATFDVVELLQPEDSVRFYVCDSRRPVDVNNVYNAVQVKLLMKPEELTNVPDFDSIYRDDESEQSGEDSDGYGDENRGRKAEKIVLHRQERRKWEDNRNKVLFDYTKFSAFGIAASLIMFEILWQLSKDTNDLVWLAVVGVTEQFLHFKTPRDKYMECVMMLQSHVLRHNHRSGSNDSGLLSVNCLRVMFDEELRLALYRHWSLFDSLCHSINMACKFRVWTLKGQKRLHEFLAEMGLPLVQCKRHFGSMDSAVRSSIKQLMQDHMTKYGLTTQDLVLPSFSAQYGYRMKLCAGDVVMACSAVLEQVDHTKSPTDYLLEAQAVLQRSNVESLQRALVLAKRQLTSLVKQVQTFLDMHQVISAGPFLYAFVQEGSPDAKFFSQPQCLVRLARYTLEAHCSVSRSRRAHSLPIVLGVPRAVDASRLLVTGIPPLDTDDERKNFFGQAFEQAARSTQANISRDHFDGHIIELKLEEKSKFFDALINLLQ